MVCPLVFQFHEEDTTPESQEHKALWDELELALREDAAPRRPDCTSAHPRGIDGLGAAHCRRA